MAHRFQLLEQWSTFSNDPAQLSKSQTLKIIQAYPPTRNQYDEEEDELYEYITNLSNKTKDQHTVVLGDFNAQVGKKNVDNETSMRRFGIDETIDEIGSCNLLNNRT